MTPRTPVLAALRSAFPSVRWRASDRVEALGSDGVPTYRRTSMGRERLCRGRVGTVEIAAWYYAPNIHAEHGMIEVSCGPSNPDLSCLETVLAHGRDGFPPEREAVRAVRAAMRRFLSEHRRERGEMDVVISLLSTKEGT